MLYIASGQKILAFDAIWRDISQFNNAMLPIYDRKWEKYEFISPEILLIRGGYS